MAKMSKATTSSNSLRSLFEIVQESRRRTAPYFPMPDSRSCIDYAITEAAEYLDAVLRAKRNGDKRNNLKEYDARMEWGQCGYMIASSIVQDVMDDIGDDELWECNTWCGDESVYTLLSYMASVRAGLNLDEYCYIEALDRWHSASQGLKYDSTELLRETCAAFEAKHIPEVTQ